MKTKGTTLTSAKLFLQLMALVLPVSISAQLSFALQKDNRPPDGKHPVPGSQVNHVAQTPVSAQKTFSLLSAAASLPVNGNERQQTGFNSTGALNHYRVVTPAQTISFYPTYYSYPPNPGQDIGIAVYDERQLMIYAEALKQFAKNNGYDTTYVFLSNMGMLCSKKRFFVVNISTMQTELSGFVTQGRGSGTSRFDKQYSNEKESHCTSLGRYKVMHKYRGEYGDSYRMMGLDSSNNNAYSRNIVLHAMGCMPDNGELTHVCISEGCPAVSVNFFAELSKIIDGRKKPVLLWIFDSNMEEAVVEMAKKDIEEADPGNTHQCASHPGKKYVE